MDDSFSLPPEQPFSLPPEQPFSLPPEPPVPHNDLSFSQDTNKTYKISNQLFHHHHHAQQSPQNIFSVAQPQRIAFSPFTPRDPPPPQESSHLAQLILRHKLARMAELLRHKQHLLLLQALFRLQSHSQLYPQSFRQQIHHMSIAFHALAHLHRDLILKTLANSFNKVVMAHKKLSIKEKYESKQQAYKQHNQKVMQEQITQIISLKQNNEEIQKLVNIKQSQSNQKREQVGQQKQKELKRGLRTKYHQIDQFINNIDSLLDSTLQRQGNCSVGTLLS